METNSETRNGKKYSGEILSRYAAIIEGSDDAIIGKTPGGIITSWNPAAERIFGFTAAEAIGESILIIFPPDRVEEEIDILEQISHGLRVHPFRTVRKRKDGNLIEVSVSSSPIIDSTGRVIGVSKIVRDLSEYTGIQDRLNRTSEDLRDERRRHREVLDSMLEGCQIIGFDGRYLYMNDAAAAQGRQEKESLLGRTMVEAYPGIEKTSMFAELRRCMEERIPRKIENRFLYEDGTAGWFKLSMQPVPEGVFILSMDITKEKEASLELEKHSELLEGLVEQRTAELVGANEELEAFSYSVSHDLRSPLSRIGGFAQLLFKRAYQGLDKESREYLELISAGVKEMSALIDDLLELSKTGRKELVKSRVALASLVDRAVKNLENETDGRSVQWRVGDMPEIDADAQLLYLVIFNLLSNAVKYTRKEKDARIEVSCRREADEYVFCVRDNGVGFDMKHADKLFGVFQRLHDQQEFEGTGVGLASVRRIISRHGGRTWAEAKSGEGAAFSFSLPVSSRSGTL